MELFSEVMPIILYFLGAVLLIVLIMLVVKLIDTVEKTNFLLDNITAKAQSLDGLFDAIDSVGETISSVNFKLISTVTNILEKIFHKKKKKKKKIEKENDEYE